MIGEVSDASGFFDAAGMQEISRTFQCSRCRCLSGRADSGKSKCAKEGRFIGTRKGIINPQKLSLKERGELIRKDPRYGVEREPRVFRAETARDALDENLSLRSDEDDMF